MNIKKDEKIKIAFAGFRHPHIFDLYSGIKRRSNFIVVACCEEDYETNERIKNTNSEIEINYDCYSKMLSEVDIDIVAIGDYYTKRGQMVIEALQAGKHVIADKPICTKNEELDIIENLSSASDLCLGLQLDLRSFGVYKTMRKLVHEGKIGEVHTVSFLGQHPLQPNSRPAWYFKDGCHGGTLNDIAIHGIDAIKWITGREIISVTAARAWNARCTKNTSFQDGAQLMLKLDNNGGAIGDVSYLSPDDSKVPLEQYWRFTIHGDSGFMEASLISDTVFVFGQGDSQPKKIPIDSNTEHQYLDDFISEIENDSSDGMLTTEQILKSSRMSLKAQEYADSQI